MRDFIDFNNIDTIKSLSKDVIVDNCIELNYLYNKALVEGDLEIVEVLDKIFFCWKNILLNYNIKHIYYN